MILRSKTLLLPSIVLLIGMIFGALAADAFSCHNPSKNIADDPFKNIGEIESIIDRKFSFCLISQTYFLSIE